MKWDRERVEPAEFIFPARTIRERDINGLVLRETVAKSIPAMSHYSITLVDTSGRWETIVASVGRASSGWSVKYVGPRGKYEFQFGLSKAEAVARLVAMANERVTE